MLDKIIKKYPQLAQRLFVAYKPGQKNLDRKFDLYADGKNFTEDDSWIEFKDTYIEGTITIAPRDRAMTAENYVAERGNDSAMLRNEQKNVRGGIDLTKVDSRLRGNDGNAGNDIRFNIDPAMLQQLQNAPGFVPVIIGIQPLNNLAEFLGVI